MGERLRHIWLYMDLYLGYKHQGDPGVDIRKLSPEQDEGLGGEEAGNCSVLCTHPGREPTTSAVFTESN